MSVDLQKVVDMLSEKLGDFDLGGSAKFNLEDVGSVIVDSDGVRISEEEADVTLSASADDFKDMLSGDLNPTNAFMSGQLRVEGDMGMAMKLAQGLS